jgi:hypothetical protein
MENENVAKKRIGRPKGSKDKVKRRPPNMSEITNQLTLELAEKNKTIDTLQKRLWELTDESYKTLSRDIKIITEFIKH